MSDKPSVFLLYQQVKVDGVRLPPWLIAVFSTKEQADAAIKRRRKIRDTLRVVEVPLGDPLDRS